MGTLYGTILLYNAFKYLFGRLFNREETITVDHRNMKKKLKDISKGSQHSSARDYMNKNKWDTIITNTVNTYYNCWSTSSIALWNTVLCFSVNLGDQVLGSYVFSFIILLNGRNNIKCFRQLYTPFIHKLYVYYISDIT